MIPQMIHYCWFGDKKIPDRNQRFIEEWKKIFPDYEIQLWNEKSFDITCCNFCRQAYNQKQYAFVSDYVRAKVLYEYGGIYLDTDVELWKKIPMLDGPMGIVGFERQKFLGTAVIAVPPKNPMIQKMMSYYENHSFLQKDGNMDIIANVSLLTDIMTEEGLRRNGSEQNCGGFHIFPREYFYPKKTGKDKFQITEETCAIHWCDNSWMTDREKRRGTNKIWIRAVRPLLQGIRKILLKIIGRDRVRRVEIWLRNQLR